jgi:hypothetical protein
MTNMDQSYKLIGENIGLAAEEGFFFKVQNSITWQELV